MNAIDSTTLLWLAVIGSGVYHGINPGMGWPLAVSAGLMDRRPGALFAALVPLGIGHFLAMAIILLPFTVLTMLVAWQGSIQIAAGIGVVCFGLFKLLYRRHPILLARIKPSQLAFWSFAVAIAHGAGFMLVPIYLGLSEHQHGHDAAQLLMSSNLATALMVSVVHAIAMIATGGLAAWVCYRYWGLKLISKSWFNLDAVWALSLVAVGLLGVISGLNFATAR